MVEKQFKPGDVVTLKSGGIRMTVWFVTDKGEVFLYYYDQLTNSIKELKEIPQSVLTLV